jgi:hypothetical protein
MIRIGITACLFNMMIQPCISQVTNDSALVTGDAARKIINAIKFDTTKFLREYSLNACRCIDSFLQANERAGQRRIIFENPEA